MPVPVSVKREDIPLLFSAPLPWRRRVAVAGKPVTKLAGAVNAVVVVEELPVEKSDPS